MRVLQPFEIFHNLSMTSSFGCFASFRVASRPMKTYLKYTLIQNLAEKLWPIPVNETPSAKINKERADNRRYQIGYRQAEDEEVEKIAENIITLR